MRIWVASLCLAAAIVIPSSAGAYTPPAGSPLANKEHPRLWLTRANLPELRAKLAGDFRSEYQAFVSDLDRRIADPKNYYYWGDDVMNYAFVYQVGPIAGISYGNTMSAYGQRARAILVTAAADVALDDAKNMGLAYDWVYDLMSPGERSSVVGYLKQIIDGTAGSGGNPFNGNDVLRRSSHILAGLAFWGDGIDNAFADAMVDKYNTLMEGPKGVLGAGSWYSGTDGGWSMGMSYSFNSATGVAYPKVMEAWRTANGYSRAQVFGAPSANLFRYYPKWFTYNIMPQTTSCGSCPGGYNFPMYHTHAMDSAKTSASLGDDLVAILSALRLYKSVDPDMAGLAQWLINQRTSGLSTTGYGAQAHAVFSQFITGEKNVTPKSPTDLGLPLTKLFSKMGWLVMRTGWAGAGDTVVTFMASPFSRAAGSYSNFNQGSFTIDRRGPLAINAGTAIHHSYGFNAWATNTMIFPDPNETSRPAWDMGGQRGVFPQLYGTAQLTTGAPHDIGGIKRSTSGSDFDYVFADVTRAYNGPAANDGYNTSKVASFTRQLVYFHPAGTGDSDRIVVFDRALTTDARFEKRWLLHPSAGVGDVSINGSGTTVRAGKVEYSGADVVSATNRANGSSGRLFLKTLLPAQRKIVLLGGPGHEFEDPYGNNDTADSRPNDPQYSGTYTVQVIPAVRGTYDNFLNVIEATDAGGGQTPTVLLTGSGVVAARVGQKIAVFSSAERNIGAASLTIDQAGTYGVLISDLSPRTSYAIGPNTLTSSDQGTIYTTVSAGAGSTLTISSGGAVAAAPPAPATQVKLQ